MPSRSPVTVPPPSPAVSTHSRLRKSHSQRFHRRFPEVDPDEPLLDYYSCALLADILLQGQLYITENYFAFYSNIFGHKTQILIPVRDVVEVTKECTARIIPNAVGICTEEEKYVFGSLLSRTSTFQLMKQIWLSSADPDLSMVEDSESGNTSSLVPNVTEDEDSGTSERRLSNFIGPLPRLEVQLSPSRRVSRRHSEISKPLLASIKRKSVSGRSLFALSTKPSWFVAKDYFSRAEDVMFGLYRLPRTTLLLLLTTVLLAVLLLSATVLLYRITVVHHKVTLMEDWQQHKHRSAGTLESRARSQLLREEILRINENLKQRIGLLTQVRQSFEQLFKATSQLPRLCNRQVERAASRP